ncbi:MAG: multicopper oxidase domain-containing protein [Acidobacteriota bacterium]
MRRIEQQTRASATLTVAVVIACFLLAGGLCLAQARIEGINGPTFNFTAKAGEISTADGGSIHFWGYQDDQGHNGQIIGGPLPQYPGPTLIVTEGQTVSITLRNMLPHPTSIVFPGHKVTATDGIDGVFTQEVAADNGVSSVTYSFVAEKPGTYMYHSGTEMDLQVEMGLVGAIIVRPAGHADWAYNHADTWFTHEYLFLITSLDPVIHQLAEQGRFAEIDTTSYWPVYWFINGRTAPDVLVGAYVPWLPHQPYNCAPRTTPGQRVLQRLVAAGQVQHPFHPHGNHSKLIARDGRLLSTDGGLSGPNAARETFTVLTVPGQTVDQIFRWTGEKMGWDFYGPPGSHGFVDANGDGYDDVTWEWAEDHGKPFPVVLPENQNLVFGGWYSGSPYLGSAGTLPPGEGGLNPNSGFFFMWHSHSEKELTNFDIFPGGLLTMMVIEPPGTPIP